MPLNREAGENIEGMDAVFRVVTAEKYMNQPRLTCIVQKRRGKKFKRVVNVEVPIWAAALEYAQEAFANAGAHPGGLAYDVIAQEYPRTSIVTFLFNATIGGEEHYVVAPFHLTPQQIADLTLRNLWLPYTVN
jgi:hypothetical protein